MERITFDDLQSKKARTIVLVAFILSLIGVFKPFNLFSQETYKWIFNSGFLLWFVFFSRMFWFKNYVQWNKRGMMLKINSWIGMGTSIRFDEVKSINFTDCQIEFTLFVGRKKRVVDIHKIDTKDKQALVQILEKYIDKNKVNFFVTLAD